MEFKRTEKFINEASITVNFLTTDERYEQYHRDYVAVTYRTKDVCGHNCSMSFYKDGGTNGWTLWFKLPIAKYLKLINVFQAEMIDIEIPEGDDNAKGILLSEVKLITKIKSSLEVIPTRLKTMEA